MALAASGCGVIGDGDVTAPARVQLEGDGGERTFPRLTEVPDGPPRRPSRRGERERLIRELGGDSGSNRNGEAAQDQRGAFRPAGSRPQDVQLAQAEGAGTDDGGPRIEIDRDQIPQMRPSQQGEPVEVPGQSRSERRNTQPRGDTRDGGDGARRIAVIQFGHGQAGLDGRDRRVLQKVATIHERTGRPLRVVGHSSSFTRTLSPIEHRVANFDMSMKRAETVANALAALGVDGDSLRVQARADRDPIYHEVMPNGQAGNRRAEIYLRARR